MLTDGGEGLVGRLEGQGEVIAGHGGGHEPVVPGVQVGATAQGLRGGAYTHPRHNWFVSAALTGDDLALVLEATDQAFAAVRKHLGQ